MTNNKIKELLVSNSIEWNKEEIQDRAFIYVDDFVEELQDAIKNREQDLLISFFNHIKENKWTLDFDGSVIVDNFKKLNKI